MRSVVPLLTALLSVLLVIACSSTAGRPPDAAPPQTEALPSAPTQLPPPAATSAAAQPPPLAAAEPPTPAPAAQAPTPIPAINVDDMMGMYPQQTVFVATPDHVSAVTLLNHFTRYRIPTNGVAQVSSDKPGQRVYLLDGEPGGTHRLRVFDVASGAERGSLGAIGDVAQGGHALATAIDGRVLVLKSDATQAWVDAYAALSLEPLGSLMETPGCGDRLLTSGTRLAVVCLSTGAISVGDLRAATTLGRAIDGTQPNVVGVAIADDGKLYVATADRHLATVPAGARQLVSIPWPSDWSGSVLADGLAVAQSGATAVIAQQNGDTAWLRVFATQNVAQRRSLRLAGVPRGGVLTLWPFAYYAVDSTIRHVDLISGLLETMAEVGAGAVPGAVVNG